MPGADQCLRRLRKQVPRYDRGNLNIAALDAGIANAAERAWARDKLPVALWPRRVGAPVYWLVERLLGAAAVVSI